MKYIWVPLGIALMSIISCDDPAELGGCHLVFDLDDYELVWSDEFDGSELDTTKWSYQIGDGCQLGIDLCGWGNNELQYYTDRPENVRVEDGKLIITARRETPAFMGEFAYTSARIRTLGKGDWRYGRFDVRAKMPLGQGLWPAIWMLSSENVYGDWPTSGEIDIMEMIGSEPSRVFGTIHYGHDFRRYNQSDYILDSGTFADEFHVFSVVWNEDCIQFMLDGKPYGNPETRTTTLPSTWPFDQYFHLILNIAVGGNLPGNPGPGTQFPQTMEVDYVRVYQ